MTGKPDLSIENSYGGVIAGIDEVGRGCWAGPVMAAAVILPAVPLPEGINDSKKLSKAAREDLFSELTALCCYAIGSASVEEIDHMNILAASQLAMQRAFEALSQAVDVALVDGNRPPSLPCKTVPVVGGDAKSLSIAAASIIAKVARDRIMETLAQEFPHYGWAGNAGYGTKTHQHGIAQHGICIHHRRSFAPIRAVLEAA